MRKPSSLILILPLLFSFSFCGERKANVPKGSLSKEQIDALKRAGQEGNAYSDFENFSMPSPSEVFYWLKEHQGALHKVTGEANELDFPGFDEGFHPQGMIKLGEEFILSAVDKRGRDDEDKKLEKGSLHRFHIVDGKIEILESMDSFNYQVPDELMSEHHPGGMDYDRSSAKLIVPVAQYKKHSTSSYLIVDPLNLSEHQLGVRVNDHIGTVVCGVRGNESCIISFNWDSKDSIKVKQSELRQSGLMDISARKEAVDRAWAYQDCKHLGSDPEKDIVYALCTATKPSKSIVMLKYTVLNEVQEVASVKAPTVGRLLAKKSMAQNPMAFEKISLENGSFKIRFYFMPHDDAKARLFIYDTPEMKLNVDFLVYD